MIAASILRRARMPSSLSPLFVRSFISEACAGRAGHVKFRASATCRLTGARGGDESTRRRQSSRNFAPRRERPMPIARMDHFTILTTNAEKTVAFYNDILGFTSGPRPAFSFPGAWLYNDGKAVLHVVERPSIPEGGGVLDHIAFWGTDPSAYVAKLKARGIKYDLRRLPENGHAAGLWQLFFFDPSGARVEIDFAASETAEGQGLRIAVWPQLCLALLLWL